MTGAHTPSVGHTAGMTRALLECKASSLENADHIGADAIGAMIALPHSERLRYARSRRGYPRAACINALEYAQQECVA